MRTLAIALLALCAAAGADAKTHVVTIHRMAYAMPATAVRAGDVIAWVNEDGVPHSATSAAAGFDATLAPGETVRTPVARTGRFEVVCKYHLGMRTVLVVVD